MMGEVCLRERGPRDLLTRVSCAAFAVNHTTGTNTKRVELLTNKNAQVFSVKKFQGTAGRVVRCFSDNDTH